jgi:AcrR family transcriptional regulator
VARTGRRPGRSGSREKILAAARSQFAKDGYDHASVRAIASTARVDPALVLHFFGSKRSLFLAAMELPFDPSKLIPELVAPGIEGLGERLVHRFIGVWDSREGRHLLGLIRSVVGHEEAARMMREFFTHTVLGKIVTSLDVSEPERRGSLVASQLFGLAMIRYVLKLEPVASASADELAQWVGPTLQRYFTADLSGLPAERRGGGSRLRMRSDPLTERGRGRSL